MNEATVLTTSTRTPAPVFVATSDQNADSSPSTTCGITPPGMRRMAVRFDRPPPENSPAIPGDLRCGRPAGHLHSACPPTPGTPTLPPQRDSTDGHRRLNRPRRTAPPDGGSDQSVRHDVPPVRHLGGVVRRVLPLPAR